MGSLRDFLIDVGRNAYGLGENVASLGSAAIAEPVAGYAAMFDPINGAAAIREGMTYQPRSEAGKMYQQGASQAIGQAVKPVMPVVDTWQRGVDIAGRYSPTLGALLQTTPTALGVALGAKPAMQTGRQVSNTLGAMQQRMIANANAPRTLNTAAFGGQRGAIGTQRPLTEFEQAHLIAQQNAALPVSKGGLGLPPNNTAMDRAKALGFDVDNPMYHGTGADFDAFDLSRSGSASGAEQYGTGVYMTNNPYLASGYANPTVKNANVMPLLARINNPISDVTQGKLTKPQIKKIISQSPELEDALWNYGDVGYEGKNKVLNSAINTAYQYQGDELLGNLHPLANDFYPNSQQMFNDVVASAIKKDGVIANFGGNDTVNVAWNPNQVRSRFAAFDPMKRESSNLLATMMPIAPTATMAAYLYNQERNNNGGKK